MDKDGVKTGQKGPLGHHDKFPFGKHRGQQCMEVPVQYYRWFLKQEWAGDWPTVMGYLEKYRPEILDDQPEEKKSPPPAPPQPKTGEEEQSPF